MIDVSLKELLAAGCHFGHQVTRWHPKAQKFIYATREGIHIIDLAQTRKGLLSACEFITKTVSVGGTVVFVGTKRQAQGVVREAAEKAGAPFITTRWPGGLLTNWNVIYKNLEKMKNLFERIKNQEERAKFTKKELSFWDKEYAKLTRLYGGIALFEKIPDVLFIVDAHKEDGAVREAVKTGVVVIAITDTNTDPTFVDYPIPANDDAVGSIKLIVEKLAEAYAQGVELRKETEGKTIQPFDFVQGKDEKKEAVKEKVEEGIKVKKPKKKTAKKRTDASADKSAGKKKREV